MVAARRSPLESPELRQTRRAGQPATGRRRPYAPHGAGLGLLVGVWGRSAPVEARRAADPGRGVIRSQGDRGLARRTLSQPSPPLPLHSFKSLRGSRAWRREAPPDRRPDDQRGEPAKPGGSSPRRATFPPRHFFSFPLIYSDPPESVANQGGTCSKSGWNL